MAEITRTSGQESARGLSKFVQNSYIYLLFALHFEECIYVCSGYAKQSNDDCHLRRSRQQLLNKQNCLRGTAANGGDNEQRNY